MASSLQGADGHSSHDPPLQDQEHDHGGQKDDNQAGERAYPVAQITAAGAAWGCLQTARLWKPAHLPKSLKIARIPPRPLYAGLGGVSDRYSEKSW